MGLPNVSTVLPYSMAVTTLYLGTPVENSVSSFRRSTDLYWPEFRLRRDVLPFTVLPFDPVGPFWLLLATRCSLAGATSALTLCSAAYACWDALESLIREIRHLTFQRVS